MYRFVYRLCRDTSTAEDVNQDAFLAAVRTIDNPGDIEVGWLIRVARNRLLDVLRRQSTYKAKLGLIGRGEVDSGHEKALTDRILVRAALDRLDLGDRLVLTLHYVEGMTIAEIAEDLDRTPKSIEALVTPARRNLRRQLEANDA